MGIIQSPKLLKASQGQKYIHSTVCLFFFFSFYVLWVDTFLLFDGGIVVA